MTVSIHDDRQLTEELAIRVMGWRIAPDRFIKPNRSWVPRWRFRPLKRLEDAFLVLDRAAGKYRLERLAGDYLVEVEVGGRVGKASGRSMPRVIVTALARSLRLGEEETA